MNRRVNKINQDLQPNRLGGCVYLNVYSLHNLPVFFITLPNIG